MTCDQCGTPLSMHEDLGDGRVRCPPEPTTPYAAPWLAYCRERGLPPETEGQSQSFWHWVLARMDDFAQIFGLDEATPARETAYFDAYLQLREAA